jgi:hypothetical protein
MDKKSLVKTLDDVFRPCGFKRKGNHWVEEGGEIIKMINLQKSEFGNFFYLNYGYILKSLPLGNVKMHVYNRASVLDPETKHTFDQILNLENDLSDNERFDVLSRVLEKSLLAEFRSINSESDLKAYLKSRPSYGAVPVSVKKYLGLEG